MNANANTVIGDIAPGLDGNALAAIALEAGAVIMEIYEQDFEVDRKDDASPVTEADRAAERLILQRLAEAAPGVPVIAEESAAEGRLPEHGDSFFLVDPVDGTKGFIRRTGEFTVNIALIHQGRPALGVVYAPALRELYVAEDFQTAWQAEAAPGAAPPPPAQRAPLRIRAAPASGLTAVASKSHRSDETNAYLAERGITDIVAASSSLKFCVVAAGGADVYPRHGRTMEWDTAAGHAVAQAAGARVIDADTGADLLYGKRERGYDNPHFIVLGDLDA